MKILSDFSALVPVFLGFARLLVSFAKRMFGILNSLGNDFHRFGHNTQRLRFDVYEECAAWRPFSPTVP